MAVTRGGYVALDDSEIAAEQPLTTSKMNRLRDNHYDALTNPASVAPSDFRVSLPLRAKTTETDTSKVLQPNGSGGVAWSTSGGPSTSSIVGVGSGSVVISDTAYNDIFPAVTIAGIGNSGSSAILKIQSFNSQNYEFDIHALRPKGSTSWTLSFLRGHAGLDVGTSLTGEFTTGNFSYKIITTDNTIKVQAKDAGANLTVTAAFDAIVF